MVSRTSLAVGVLAAAFCVVSQAQSSSSPQSQNPAPQPAAPSQTPPAPQQTAPPPSQPPAPSLQLHDLPAEPHTPTPAEAEQQRRQAEVNAAARVADLQAHWGPEMDTPGYSMALTEAARTKAADGTTQITYHITGSGFPVDEKLILIRWPLNVSTQTIMGGIGFNANGIAVCTDAPPPAATPAADAAPPVQSAAPPAPAPSASSSPAGPEAPSCATTMKPQQPVEIQATVAAGEAVRVALLGPDRRHGAAAIGIPFPIVNADKGCRLQVILGTKNAALVLIEGTGFPPNAEVKLDTMTASSASTLRTKTNGEGRLIIPVLLNIRTPNAGETTVRFAGIDHPPSLQGSSAPATPDPACAPAVSYHWGEGAYKLE
jgi:hypothetical protein